MRVTVLGASPSFPNPGGASSSYLVAEGRTRVLIDCGHGSASRLFRVMDPRHLDGVVLSHLHPDHFFDLVPLVYALRFLYTGRHRIPLWLPPDGTERLQRFFASLDLDRDFLDRHFDVEEYEPSRSIRVGTIKIEFAPTQHFVPAFAMRLTPWDRDTPAIGYSSDTGPSEVVARLLTGVDLAIVEASLVEYPEDEEFHGHLTGKEAARLARQAGVSRLILTHYAESEGAQLLRQALGGYQGLAAMAGEGDTYEV